MPASCSTKPFLVPFALLLLSVITLVGCKNYGTRVSKEYLEVYYSKGVTSAQADKTLEYLYPLWRTEGDATQKKSIQLTKTGDTVNFRMVADPGKVNTLSEENMGAFIKLMSDSLYDQAPVNMDICDKEFKTIKSIRYSKKFTNGPATGQPVSTEQYGDKVVAGNIEVYAKQGVDPSLVRKLAKYIDEGDGSDIGPKSFQLLPDGGGYIVKMVTTPQQAATQPDAVFVEMASLISRDVFNGTPVKLALADNMFVDFKEFGSK